MEKLTDDEIKHTAIVAGFWGTELWWGDAIPRFRRFLELCDKLSDEKEAGEVKNEPLRPWG